MSRSKPDGADILARLDAAVACGRDIATATAHLTTVNDLLKGVPGVMALADNLELMSGIEARLARLDETIARLRNALGDES